MIVVLAVGFAFYIPLGVRRGGMQGMCSFRRLASSYVAEALLKFVAMVVLSPPSCVRGEASGKQQGSSHGPEAGFVHKSRKRSLGEGPAFLMLPYPPSREGRDQRQVYESVGCGGWI
jgi:hypothetical protein